MPGATTWLYDPLPNSIEQLRMVHIVTGYMLFVTLQYDIISTFANQRLAKFIDTTCILFYTHFPSRCCTMRHYNEHNYQPSKEGDRNKTQQHSTLSQSSQSRKNIRHLVKTGK